MSIIEAILMNFGLQFEHLGKRSISRESFIKYLVYNIINNIRILSIHLIDVSFELKYCCIKSSLPNFNYFGRLAFME